MDSPILTQALDSRDVLMVQAGGRSALLYEPLYALNAFVLFGWQHFERYQSIKLLVAGQEHASHSTDPDRPLDQVRIHGIANRHGKRG